MRKDIRKLGMEAARTGLALCDCPYYRAKVMPAHTGEPISNWVHRVDAWESGWQEATDARLERQDCPAKLCATEARVLAAQLNILRQHAVIDDLAERSCDLKSAIELLQVMQDILRQYENRLAWLATRDERRPLVGFHSSYSETHCIHHPW